VETVHQLADGFTVSAKAPANKAGIVRGHVRSAPPTFSRNTFGKEQGFSHFDEEKKGGRFASFVHSPNLAEHFNVPEEVFVHRRLILEEQVEIVCLQASERR
jgi:hypothetical protein